MLFALFSNFTSPTVLASSEIDTSVNDEFGKKVDQLLDQKGFSGSILVIRDGKPIYRTSRGYADNANNLDNKKNTAYEIDSVQKSMTAALVMKEVQKGKLTLKTKLSRFYPQVPGSDRITIRQMLDMTSGLSLKGNIGPSSVLSDSGIIAADMKNIKFSNLLYNKWNYQAINYNLLSGILEQLTGKSYRKLFIDNYVKKLHLKKTIFAYNDSSNIQKALGYNNSDPLNATLNYKQPMVTPRSFEYDELGTGQVYMSTHDLFKVEHYIMSGPMLTKASRQTLFKSGSISTYGGGLYHAKNDNFANGWGYGFQTVMHISDNGQNAVVVLENYQRLAADVKPIAKQIYGMANQ